jgi:quercetin dioxygenase-like cupin family protein
MRVRILVTVAMLLLIAAPALTQQSGQQPTTGAQTSGQQPAAQQPMSMPPQSGQQPIGQPTSTPQQAGQQPMTMPQQTGHGPMVKSAAEARFANVPGLPDCVTSAVQRGDPKTSSSVTFVKVASGCTVPWHWHSASEEVMFVSGTGQLQAKGQQVENVSSGAYAFMPAQHHHQITCSNGCSFYRSSDGPVDIHYVDTAGNEISPETALAAVGERPAKIVASQQQ